MQLPLHNEIVWRSKARVGNRVAEAHARAVESAMASHRDISGRHMGRFSFGKAPFHTPRFPPLPDRFRFYHEQKS